jgi:tyrosine-protein phosphatase YwqE
MNRYQLLKENENILYQLVRNGIITVLVMRDMEIYERYEAMTITNNESKYLLLGDEYELSTKRIQQIVYNMQSKIRY